MIFVTAVRAGVLIASLSVLPIVEAQPSATPSNAPQNVSTTASGGDSGHVFAFDRLMTRFEFWLTLLVTMFGVIVVVIEYLLLRKREISGEDALKVFTVTMIIVGTLVLITAGFGDKQIAPAMGLFGTISGYLLGRIHTKQGTNRIT